MPGRALTIETTPVAAAERERFVEALRLRRRHYKRANCNFWAFEQLPADGGVGGAGAFVVFTEAADDAHLLEARRDDPSGAATVASPLYREVDLSHDS